MRAQQAELRSCRIVFGKRADLFEQLRAARVVEESRREPFLRRRQAIENFLAELRERCFGVFAELRRWCALPHDALLSRVGAAARCKSRASCRARATRPSRAVFRGIASDRARRKNSDSSSAHAPGA